MHELNHPLSSPDTDAEDNNYPHTRVFTSMFMDERIVYLLLVLLGLEKYIFIKYILSFFIAHWCSFTGICTTQMTINEYVI